jgi:hypothetical protein
MPQARLPINTLVKARTIARVRVAASRAITDAKARTAARAKVAALPTVLSRRNNGDSNMRLSRGGVLAASSRDNLFAYFYFG